MKSEAAKLPEGQSYLLKPSVLATALASAGLTIDTHLVRSPGTLFDVHFWPPENNVAYERLYVRAGSVPSGQAAEARRHVETVTIPALIKWLADILEQDTCSPIRREKQVVDLRLA
jgi:hypothetical protein